MKRAYRQLALHRLMIQAQADEQREQESAPLFDTRASLYRQEVARLNGQEREEQARIDRAYLASLTPYERATHGLLIGPVYRPRLDPLNPEHPEHPNHVPF